MRNQRRKVSLIMFLLVGLVFLSIMIIWVRSGSSSGENNEGFYSTIFNGDRAYRDVEYQVSLGPRVPGSEAHSQAREWIISQLEQSGWQADIQEAEMMGQPIYNIVGQMEGGDAWIILGAHYDSRLIADHDPTIENRLIPVPGANDGASGVAVLLELARVWPNYAREQNSSHELPHIWLVFFDAEDNGNLVGWDWILGSRAFVAHLESNPDAVVILDMIGDEDLNIYQERNSDPILTGEIWSQARGLGYEKYFVPELKHRILDDHIPFIEAGIPAVDLIDFDYPYWHTVEDTPDKVSALSLAIVGNTILAWLRAK